MTDYSFLRFDSNAERAADTGESPIVKHLKYGQIQLLPQNPFPYFFNSDQLFGVGVTAYFADCNDNREDITAHFTYDTIGDRSAFRLAYLPNDYGLTPVRLVLEFSNSDTLYSNYFLVTNNDSHLTSRIDYKLPSQYKASGGSIFVDYYLSCNLSFYFYDHKDQDEVSTYQPLSTGENITTNAIHSDLLEWHFESINRFTHVRLKRALQKSKSYINGVRNNAIESFEYEGREGLSNLAVTKFLTDEDPSDTYLPQEVIIGTSIPDNDIQNSYAYDYPINF